MIGFLAPGFRFWPFRPCVAGFSSCSLGLARPKPRSPPAVVPLFRVFPRRFCPIPLDSDTSLEIFAPLSVSVPEESTYPSGFPAPRLRAVFRVSHPLHGLILLRPCGFVSPHNAFRLFPSGISPPKEQTLTLRQRHAVLSLLRRLRSRYLGERDPRRTSPPPLGCGAGALGRLHGFAPLESPFRARLRLAL